MTNIDRFGRIKTHDSNNKRITESRLIWQKEYGIIPKGYVIHHIDNNPANNILKNLKLLSRREHDRLHNFNNKELIKYNWLLAKERIEKGETWKAVALDLNCARTTLRKNIKRMEEL